MANDLQTWDGEIPLACRIEGDRLYADFDVARFQRGDRPRADDLEREQRLYLRLANLAVEQRDGSVTMRSGWQHEALEFATLYAPSVDYSFFRLFRREGTPLAHFVVEALLLWWTLRLREHLSEPRGSLRKALEAVVQIYRMFPVAENAVVAAFYLPEWQKLLSSFDLQVPVKAVSREQWFPATSGEVCGLRPKEVKPLVDDLYRQYEHDEGRLWQLAHNVFATVVNVRLTGVTLMCLPAGERPTAAPSVGFHFLTPLARIWYGLWEDLAGIRFRRCARARCGKFFPLARKSKRFCEKRCQDAERQARYRQRESHATKPRKDSTRKTRGTSRPSR